MLILQWCNIIYVMLCEFLPLSLGSTLILFKVLFLLELGHSLGLISLGSFHLGSFHLGSFHLGSEDNSDRCSFHLGILINVLMEWSWLLARIHWVGLLSKTTYLLTCIHTRIQNLRVSDFMLYSTLLYSTLLYSTLLH